MKAEKEANLRHSIQRLLADAITHSAPVDDLKVIIKYGGDVNGAVNRGLRPIHYAAYADNIEAIRVLLRYGCNVNIRDDVGYTAVHLCARKGHYNCLKYLIKHGAKVNTDGEDYIPKLKKNQREDENEEDNDGFDDEESAKSEKATTFGTSSEPTKKDSQNVHRSSSQNENVRQVQTPYKVPDASAAPLTLNLHDLTIEPINLALENNNVKIVELLLENGANPNRHYFMGFEINLMPLNNLECLELLLDYGADPNSVSRTGMTPLMKAAKENLSLALRLLLKKGANVNQQCPEKFEQKTALHIALESGNCSIARTLLLQNANPNKMPNYKYNALHTAVLADRVDLVELLLHFKIDIDEMTDENCTSLMLACAENLKNQNEIVSMLLKAGANPNAHAKDINYTAPCFSPLIEYLRQQETFNYDIVFELIQYGAIVHFVGFTTVTRKKDPYGIMFYMAKIDRDVKLINILTEASREFDPYAISRCKNFSDEEKEIFMIIGRQPLPLKRLIRIFLHDHLQPLIIDKIKKLPLPDFLIRYLLFKAD